MRRVFVIFLALLFPLNVFALSMSVASMETAGAARHAASPVSVDAVVHFADMVDGDTACDIDPDEPPAGMDFHDSVHAAVPVALVVPPDGSIPSPVPPRRGRDPLPPIKPPPAA
jgi:hypothetical protein